MPQMFGRTEVNEPAFNKEEALCLALRVHLDRLLSNLIGIFAHLDTIGQLITDKEQLNEIVAMADALELRTGGVQLQLQQQEQADSLIRMLLLLLIESSVENKLTQFLQILHDNSYTQAADLLQLSEHTVEAKFFSRLAEFFSMQHLTRSGHQQGGSVSHFATEPFLNALLDFVELPTQDISIADSDGDADIKLLTLLTQKCNNWCETFVLALVFAGFNEELDLLLPGFQSFVQFKHNKTIEDLRTILDGTDADSTSAAKRIVQHAVQEFLLTNHRPFEVADIVMESDSDKQEVEASAAAAAAAGPVKGSSTAACKLSVEEAEAQQQLREYQLELAQPGKQGANCVIIAPTGSGKTLVSIEIARSVLQRNPQARVAFLADRTQLVDQQFAAFDKELRRHGVRQQRGGASVDKFPLKLSLQHDAVHIISTQILLNSLQDKGEDGLNGDVSQFQLLIFDECHHCDKDHPSKKIMEFYFEFKEQHGAARLPQIVGLTASPGTGGAYSLEDSVEHVMKICANLDCRQLVTVRQSQEELRRHVKDPKAELHSVDAKENDPVLAGIEQLMAFAEQQLLEVAQSAKLQVDRPPAAKGSFIYTNFCGNLHRAVLQCSDDSSRAVFACWRCLTHCNTAHCIGSLFRSCDAVQYLRRHLIDSDSLRADCTCAADAAINRELRAVFASMQRFCQDNADKVNDSPALNKLAELLRQQFAQQPDSRVIVFVQQRYYTQAVHDYLRSARPDIRSAVMTGANAAGDAGGITQNEQTDILKDFREGKYKILISTSVSEEGVDVEKCNMVIRFCHVTNEIAMVQSKGRGRAEDSTYHVIVPPQLDWLLQKERANENRDRFMRKAVERIGAMDPAAFANKIASLQNEQELQRQIVAAIAPSRAASLQQQQQQEQQVYDLLCKSCNKFMCSSSDLRQADKHYIVLNGEIILQQRFRLLRSRKNAVNLLDYPMICGSGNCTQRWGFLRKFKNLIFPMLEVKSVKFFNSVTGKPVQRSITKWSSVLPIFSVPAVTPSELRRWATDAFDQHLDALIVCDDLT